jgi:hypothetical protein
MSTLLEAIGIMLDTHFRFRFLNRSSIRDSLIHLTLHQVPSLRYRFHTIFNLYFCLSDYHHISISSSNLLEYFFCETQLQTLTYTHLPL